MFKHLAKIAPRSSAHTHIQIRGTAPALAHITPPPRASASSSIRTAATLSAPLQLSSKLTAKHTFEHTNPYTPSQAKTMSTSVSQAPQHPRYPAASEPGLHGSNVPQRPLTPRSGQHHRVGQDGRQDGRVQAPGQLVPQLRLARARRRVPAREGPLPPLRLVRLPLGAPDAHREEA